MVEGKGEGVEGTGVEKNIQFNKINKKKEKYSVSECFKNSIIDFSYIAI